MHKPFVAARLIIGILASVLLLAGCGNSAATSSSASSRTTTQSSTTQADATPPATAATLSETYNSTDGVYTFQYPAGWVTQAYATAPVVNGALAISSDAADYFFVLPMSEDISAQATTFFNSFLIGFGGSDINTTAQSDTAVGANTWSVNVATFTKNGTAYDGVQFSLVRNGSSFLVLALAPHTTSSDDGTKYFQPMLTSLAFQQ